MEVLKRIQDRKDHGIIYRRGGAGKENVPSNTRLGGWLYDDQDALVGANDKYEAGVAMQGYMDNFSIGDQAEFNECKESDLYKLDALDDTEK